MSCSHQNIPGSQIEIKCEMDSDTFRNFELQSAKEFSETIDIKGFRKGQAPAEIVRQHVSREKLLRRAAELAVQKIYPEYVLEKNIEVIGPPEVTITKLALGNPLEFKVKIAVLPEINLPDYKQISRQTKNDKKPQEVSEKEVEQALTWVQDAKAQSVAIERGAQTNDRVEIDFEGKKDGVTIEKLTSHSHPIILGKTKLIPGLEQALLGMKEGEEKIIDIKLPEDFSEPILKEAEIQMRLKMTRVEERLVPALTDEFAQSLGSFNSLESLKKSIREGLAKEKEAKEKDRVRALVADRIAQEAVVELPEILIEAELEKMLGELKENIKDLGIELPTYLEKIGKTQEDLRKEWRVDAQRRVKISLVLREIAQREKIHVPQEEIAAKMNEFLKAYASAEETRKNVDVVRLGDYTKGVLRNEKVFEFLESQ